MRAGPHYYSIHLCRTDGLRLDDFAHWKRVRADDRFLYGGSDEHKLRYKQHTELDSSRGGEYCHHAGDIHVHIRDWFDEREPGGDDHLYTDGYQCRGLDHFYANRYRKHKQTNNQLLLSEPRKYHCGFQQYTELGDDWGDEHRHHAGDIHVHIRGRFDEREPNGDDYLHTDGFQRRGLDYIHGNSHCNSVRRSAGDNDHFMPRRNTRRSV